MNPAIEVVEPSGVIDGVTAGQLRQQISNCVHRGAEVVLLDLNDVTFMDSAGLGAIVVCSKMIKAAGAELSICSANEQVDMVFTQSGMDRVFDIFANRDEFNKAILSTDSSLTDGSQSTV